MSEEQEQEEKKKSSSAGTWCMLVMFAIITSVFVAHIPDPNPKPASLSVNMDSYREKSANTIPHISTLANWNEVNVFGLVVRIPEYGIRTKIPVDKNLRSSVTGGVITEIEIQLRDLSVRIQHTHYLYEKPDPIRAANIGVARMKSMKEMRITSDSVTPMSISGCNASLTSVEHINFGKPHTTKAITIEFQGNLWQVIAAGPSEDMDYIWPEIMKSVYIRKR